MSDRQWLSPGSALGLFLALFSLPLIALGFKLFAEPLSGWELMWRESLMFSSGVALLFVARREGLSWSDLGMARQSIVRMTAVVLAGLALMAAILVLDHWLSRKLGLINAFGRPVEGMPLWVLALMSVRAGVLEELFYRAYAIGRLEALTGSRWLAVSLPLIVFTLLHSWQGLNGLLLAFLGGAGLTALYLFSRNLWACMIVHFLVDYAPTALRYGYDL